MKRKKWSEMEEQTLILKYSELLESGVLSKLKTREKKFKPIADQVNSLHHLQDPISFPFKWTWRDVSIKVQNMRHQYLGVKQKIRISENEFNWDDGENHWDNFLKYKEVFGDIELSDTVKDKKFGEDSSISNVLALGYPVESECMDDDEEEEEEIGDVAESDEGEKEERFFNKMKKGRRLKLMKMSTKVLDLREVIMRREEKRRDREWNKEIVSDSSRNNTEMNLQKLANEKEEELLDKEVEIQELQLLYAKRETQKRMKLEKELSEEKRRRIEIESKWEEQDLEWKERMVKMQIEHEKQMMQIQSDSCQTQIHILGLVARIICHFYGSASNDGLGSLATQELQNLAHQGGLSDGSKPDSSLPSVFQ